METDIVVIKDSNELQEVLKTYNAQLADAIKRKAIDPHNWFATELVEMCVEMEDQIADYIAEHPEESQYILYGKQSMRFMIGLDDTRKGLRSLERYEPRFTQKLGTLCELEEEAEEVIKLSVLPSGINDLDTICTARAMVFVPIKADRYHVLTLKTDRNDEWGRHTQRPVRFNDAFGYIDPRALKTVAIASGTEQYPLIETALPILARKYHEAISRN